MSPTTPQAPASTPTATALPELPAACRQRIDRLLATPGRKLIGLVGPPGAGKSTVAAALLAAYADLAQVVPMDGYHLANVELARLGRAGRKGAPDTFDSAGYLALLQRLRDQGADETVYAPEFRREIEEPIAGAIAVHPTTRLVITEGNYLLLPDGAWSRVPALLDDCWFVEVDGDLRRERLVRRHMQFGRSQADAIDWEARTDAPNARLIEAHRARASWVFRWDGGAA